MRVRDAQKRCLTIPNTGMAVTIDGDAVVVTSPEVLEPVAARYAYAMNPDGRNLYNREGLPVSPFRTESASCRPLRRPRYGRRAGLRRWDAVDGR